MDKRADIASYATRRCNGQTEKPRDIKDTRVGPLLATDRALYRFSKANGWILVASGDLGGDVSIIPIPKIEGVAADIPVFVEARNGVFAWIESHQTFDGMEHRFLNQ